MQWVTHVKRSVFPKQRLILNDSLADCWKEQGWELPNTYLPSQVNVAAGYASFLKYDKAQPIIDMFHWNLSYTWLERHFHPYMAGSTVLPMDLVKREMKMDTSPGYPWNLSYATKTDFLKDERMSQVLQDFHEEITSVYPTDINVIWTCSVKGDEMRPVAKILDNKLRTFTASPFEHSLNTNLYCLDMNNKFYKSAFGTWSFVGASKFRGGWNRAGVGLDRHPSKYSLDGKEWDSSIFAAALWDQCRIRYSFLKPEFRTSASWNALRNIYSMIIDAICVLDLGDLIRKFTGNPSGSANTIVDNTMILIRLMFYAWLVLSYPFRKDIGRKMNDAERDFTDPDLYQATGEEKYYDYEDMMNNVFMLGNGDDDVFSVSDAMNSWFNARAIAGVWLSLGIITTADSLDAAVLTAIRFLSQLFVVKSGMYMPSPESEKVLGSLYAGSGIDDIRWHLMRAYALRIDSFMNDECRLKIETYINYILENYQDQLVGEVGTLTMNQIHKMWKSDDELTKLYTGYESTRPEVKVHARLVSLLYQSSGLNTITSTTLPITSIVDNMQDESWRDFGYSALRGLVPGAETDDSIAALMSALVGFGVPLAWVASNSSPMVDSTTDPSAHERWVNQQVKDYRKSRMFRKPSQINGDKGSATNTDDHAWLDDNWETRVSLSGKPKQQTTNDVAVSGPRLAPLRGGPRTNLQKRIPISLPIPRGKDGVRSRDREIHYDPTEPPHTGQSIPAGVEKQTKTPLVTTRGSQINGNNGSATNTDDHAMQNASQVRKELKQIKKAVKKKHPGKTGIKRDPKTRWITVQQAEAMIRAHKAPVPRELKLVRSLASRYTISLKNPAIEPPRLGSSGETPTIMVHGYYVNTFTMGIINSLQATEALAYISPRLFQYSNASNQPTPLTVTIANSTSGLFNQSGVAALSALGYTNEAAIYASLGMNNTTNDQPVGRMLSAAVSIDCRCPGTTARPYMWGGLLPQNNTLSAYQDQSDISKQLQSYSSNNIRGFPSTVDVPGMTISARYFPKDATALNFSTVGTATTIQQVLLNGAIPYVGMSGCSAGTTFTVTASVYWEVQCQPNGNARAGYKLGPKASSEEIFNELKRFPSVSTQIQQIGAKVVDGSASTPQAMMMANAPHVEEETKTLAQKVMELEKKLSTLLEEQKQYECSSCDRIQDHVGLCAECDIVERQKLNTIENNGVTSVDTTPEVVTRQLDALKYHLTGKIPAVADLLKHGLGPTNKEMHAMNGNGASMDKMIVTDDDIKQQVQACQDLMCYSCLCKITYTVLQTDPSWANCPKKAKAALGQKLITGAGKCSGWCDPDSQTAMNNIFKPENGCPVWLRKAAQEAWTSLAKVAVESGPERWNKNVKDRIQETGTSNVFEYLGKDSKFNTSM